MTTATSKPEAGHDTAAEKERWLRAYRQMVSIRLFEEQVNEVYTRALMPGLATCIAVKKPWLWESVKLFASTTTSRARTAATGTALPRAQRQIACLPSYWEKKPAIAAAKADRCTSPTPQPAT